MEDDSLQYLLDGQPLQNVKGQKDLRLLMTPFLKLSSQCQRFVQTELSESASRKIIMAQKFLEPFKKLPQKIQNLPWVQKFQDFTTELDAETGHWRQKCSVELPFSKEEGLTALTVGKGIIYIGSTSGTLRQVAVHNGCMTVGEDELNSLSTHIILTKVPDAQRQQLNLPSTIVSIEVDPTGNHLVIGYAGGTAVVAEPQPVPVAGETHAPTESVEAALPTDTNKVEPAPETASSEPQAAVPTEVQPQHPDENGHASEKSKEESSAPSESGPVTEKAVSEKEAEEKTGTGDKRKDHLQAMRAEATKKFRTLSKTLRNTLMDRPEEKPAEPPIPVPPSPRVTHILPYTQALCCASWHIASLEPGHPLQVIVAYDDGAHLTWRIPTPEGTQEDPIICANQENATIPYGPLPCAPIRKIMTRPSANGGVITVIVGGLPRAEHSDKHTVSVIGSVDEHVCFQFGSPVRDFVILPPHSGKSSGPEAASTKPESAEQQQPPVDEAAAVEGADSGAMETHFTLPATPTEPGYLLVLTERELVAIDLTQPSWPVLPSPYLGCLGCSAVTASAHIALPEGLMKRLQSCGRVPQGCPFKDWPINGGVLECPAKAATKEGETPADAHCSASLALNASNDILALGHANGDVSLWALGRGDFLRCLCHVHVFSVLEAGDACHSEHKTEYAAWPPFRRVGDCTGSCCTDSTFAPDPRVSVRTLSLQLSENAEELLLLAGGGAGQIVQWTTASVDGHFEPDVSRLQVDLLAAVNSENPSFVWEGQPALKACEGVFAPCPTACPLFMPQGLVQLEPPSAITAVAWEPRWHALAVGSAYGFALIDLKTHSVVYNRFTYGLTFADDQPAGAAKKIAAGGRHLKATLRQSFRKLRKPRVSAPARVSTETEPKKSDGEAAPEAAPGSGGDAGDETIAGTASAVVDEAIHSAETAAVESKAPRSEQEEEPGVPSEEAQHTEIPSIDGPHVLKPTDAALSTSVHCLTFADTFIVSPVPAKEGRPAVPSTRVPTLWVGTYGGAALAHRLSWPAAPAGPISVSPVKELQLKHAAPVLGVCVLDAKSHVPLGPTEKNRLVAELIEEPATEAPAKTEDQPAESVASPDKPAEEKAPEAEEKAAALTCPETHELLICTEEQVKIFALPSLRPKHKYRFWGKPVSAMGTASQPQSATAGEEQSQVPPAEVSAATTEAPTEPSQEAVSSSAAAEEKTEEHVTEATEVTCQKTCRLHARGRVAAFGLQQFPRSSHATGSSNASGSASDEWHIVLALQNGCINALSLANLRRDLKAYCCSQSDNCVDKLLTPCVCNHANLVFWPLSTGQVVANELSCIPPQRLASVLLTTPGITGSGYCIQLPEWTRPAVKSVVEAATEAAEAAATQVSGEVTEAVKVATEAVAEPVSEVGKAAVSAVEDTVATVTTSLELGANSIAQQVGDITMDSIKEYLNDSGAVTVKTTENSLEKHTIIEGGHVMTTVHETERVDGEIVKDDIVQVKSTNEAEPSAISGQA
ncbi:Lethal(2) giant larvae protein 1 [Sparganum proliferum]